MSETNTEYTPVKYVRNADDTVATAALSFLDDNRPNLPIGGVGLVTNEELQRYGLLGVILEQVDEDQVPEEVSRAVYGGKENLDDLPLVELKRRLAEVGGDASGLKTKADFVNAIGEATKVPEAEGVASLPATATAGPVPPAPAAGSPAGGAAASTPSTGGATTTGGGGAS